MRYEATVELCMKPFEQAASCSTASWPADVTRKRTPRSFSTGWR